MGTRKTIVTVIVASALAAPAASSARYVPEDPFGEGAFPAVHHPDPVTGYSKHPNPVTGYRAHNDAR